MLVLRGRILELSPACPPGRVRRTATARGTRLVATLLHCPRGSARLHVQATIAPGCQLMRGTARVRGTRRAFRAARSTCGDGRLDAGGGERCDGAELGGATCATLGFGADGRLGCGTDCTFDVRACGRCGNGRIDPGEVCDGYAVTAVCENGGRAVCRPDCRGLDLANSCRDVAGPCGDGMREGGEQCDGSDTPGCQPLGFDAGLAACRMDCTVDPSGCTRCGNGQKEPGEPCDGADLGGASCPEGGTLRCADDCSQLDRSGCFFCGNGRREGDEECDGGDLGGAGCDAPAERGGELRCTADCRLDRLGCWRCGNGNREPGEQCDDGNRSSGDGCSADCTSECGDGVVEGPEECDDGNAVLNDGCSFCSLDTLFGGGGAEETDCNLAWGVAGVPAAPAVGCTDGDASCDQGSSAGDCAFHVTLCLNVAARLATRCVPSGIARVALAAESLAAPAALEPSAQAAVLDTLTAALEWAPGTTVVREGTTLTATPPMTRYADVCRPLAVVVPARATRTVALLVTDPQERVDADAIAFSCAPAP